MANDERRTTAEFTIELQPGEAALPGTGRFDFTKVWSGGLSGTGRGVMLSAGDPATGTAGYVALETVDGALDGVAGTLALQQFGTMDGGVPTLRYEIVPGSGTGGLMGVTGSIDLAIVDGQHRVTLTYRCP